VPSGEIAALLDALGEVAERIGAYDEAERSYREAGRRLAAEPVALARVLSKQAIVAEKTGRYVPALRLLGRGLRLLEGMDDAGSASVRAELATRYAGGRFRQGRHREAARWCVVAIAEAERAGDRAGLAWAYLMLDAVNTERGGGDEPPYGRLALPMLEELGELQGLARQLVNLGARAFYEGDWPEAAALYDRGLELFRRIGDAAGEAQTGFNLGELLVRQGRLDTAEAYLADAARFWRAAGDRIGVALAVSELALVAARRGGAQRALELLAEARAEFARAGAEADLLETDARICEVLVAAGEGERALALVEDLLARMRSSGEIADVREHRLLRLRGEALALLGRAVAAREALEASLAGARGAKALLEEAHALGALARAAGGPAEVLDAQRREILERLGAA
jgi:tetratricopeptide (TPR) repeat protein